MSFLSKLFAWGEQGRGESIDAQLEARNRARLEQGYYTPEIYQQAEEHLSRGRVNVSEQINGEFLAGLKEGKENEENFVLGGLKTILGAVPWFVWVAGIIAILLYLGGGVWLLKKSKGVLAK